MAKPKRVYARRRKPEDSDDDSYQPRLSKWWRSETGQDCAAQLWAWVDRLRAQWSADGLMDLIHEAIYRGRPVGSNRLTQGGAFLLLRSGTLLNLNIVMSMVDTATARLTKRRPMPCLSADDAAWSEKLFAKRASRILRRKMGGADVERMSPRIIRDMVIRGDGCAKVVRFGGDVTVERIPAYELVVDPFEAEHGLHRSMAHIRPEPREVLCARYPAFAREINDAPVYNRADPWSMFAYQNSLTSDYVEVAEAWHLPSGPDEDDGQHVVALKGCVILREGWARPRYPIARCQWSPPTRGFRGCGLVEQLAGIQEQINDILRDAREGLKNGSQLTVFVQRGANVNKHHLRARHPKVVEFDGAEPHYVAPNPVSEQAIKILLLLIDKAYEISGISQMAASSKNTLGANASGKAIDTMDDLQSDRFAHVESDYMQFRCELGMLMIDEARAMAAPDADGERFVEQPEPIAKKDLAPWIRETEWRKVEVDGGLYSVVLEPVNYLVDSRSGRLDQVRELGQAGMIPDPAIQADMFDEPDLQRANRTVLGPKHCLDRIMEGLADVTVPMLELQPDQYMNLPLGVLMAKGELNEAMADRADDDVLERYREWIEAAKQAIGIGNAADQAVSPQGMLANNMGAQQSAQSLQPGLGAGPAPMAPVEPAMAMAQPGVMQ